MCGIAGFNCTTEVAEGIEFDAFIRGAQAMAKENYHRGGDAAGFMMQFNGRGEEGKENSTYWWKAPGLGKDIGDKVREVLTEEYGVGELVPNVFAVHTRAKSTGFTENDNENNHPVVSGNVLTTHNGMVSNHFALKTLGEKLYEKDWKAGAVDSLAIPIMFRGVEDPVEQYDTVGRILPQFEGGFAYHTIWTQKPGASLLVAGERYPLVVSIKDGIVAYSSEAPCIRKCLPLMGPTLDGALVRKMDPGTFLIVYDGEIVHKGTYDLERKEHKKLTYKSASSTTSKDYMRWVPQANEWFKRKSTTKVGVTTGITEDVRFYSSIDHTLPEEFKVKLLYTRKDGVVDPDAIKDVCSAWKQSSIKNKKSEAPTVEKGDNLLKLMDYRAVFEDVCEADAIWGVREPDATGYSPSFILYAWYDKTEVVMTDTGNLVGIYNWADGEMDRPVYATQYDLHIGDKEARDKEEAERKEKLKSYRPYELDTETNVKKWIKKNSIAPTIPLSGEKIVGGDDSSTGKVVRPSQWPHQTTTTTGTHGDFDKILLDEPSVYLATDPDIMTWMGNLDERNVLNSITLHMSPNITIPLLWSEMCDIHDQPLVTHKRPLDCINVVAAAAITVSFFEDIFTWQHVFDSELGLVYSHWSNKSTGCKHDWKQMSYGMYDIWGYQIPLLEEEVCDVCGAHKKINDYPLIIRKFLKVFADDYDRKRAVEAHGGMYL